MTTVDEPGRLDKSVRACQTVAMKKLLMIPLAALTFAACGEDADPAGVTPQPVTVPTSTTPALGYTSACDPNIPGMRIYQSSNGDVSAVQDSRGC